jgi:hypothetical protein
MKRWPDLPPLPVLLLDRADEMEALAKSLPEFVAKVYQHAESLLGAEGASDLFKKTIPKRDRGEHGPWQNLLSNRDAFLLREYDRASRRLTPPEIKRVARILGDLFDGAAPGKLGANAAAITHRIRELVRERKIRRAQQSSKASHTLLSGIPTGGN